jgi:hypothetical protein
MFCEWLQTEVACDAVNWKPLSSPLLSIYRNAKSIRCYFKHFGEGLLEMIFAVNILICVVGKP